MNWKLVWMAFATLFLAELGDKTQIAVFTMASEHGDPWPIFVGASLALVVVTFIGAFFGGVITRFIPMQVIEVAAGLLFVGMGVAALWKGIPALMALIVK